MRPAIIGQKSCFSVVGVPEGYLAVPSAEASSFIRRHVDAVGGASSEASESTHGAAGLGLPSPYGSAVAESPGSGPGRRWLACSSAGWRRSDNPSKGP
jgi:hypothetical protein